MYQVDAFTNQRFKGNPAGVVANADGLTPADMQAVARELGNSETAFVLSPTSSDHDAWVRFFTPTTEVPSCGHATIAAHYVRAIENKLTSCTIVQKIGAGLLPVDIKKEEDDYTIVMTQGEIEFSEPLAVGTQNRILGALGLGVDDLDTRCPVEIVSTGHSKVLVGIQDRSKLHSLQPDLTALEQLSSTIGCNGYFVFALGAVTEKILAHGRMFAPAIGIPEDPVTGNGNGPLGAYLVNHKILDGANQSVSFRARQGEAMGRPGEVSVTVEMDNGKPTKVRVGGRAVIVFRTDLVL